MSSMKFLKPARFRRLVNLAEYQKNIDNKISEQSITFEKPDKTFSFGSMDTDLRITENPNLIEDKKFSMLNNDSQLADDKFDNVSDPFYELDEERSQIEKMDKLNTTATTNIKKKVLRRTKATAAKTKQNIRY